jgi:tripartite-type tricarboxylate transporter receptor subunit TctC
VTLRRRRFLHMAAGIAALPALPRATWAQPYPSRPVTLIVFVPAGGSPDISARFVGQSLSQRLGQTVVIENRPGAGGELALQAVARAPADGYTLLLVAVPHAINVTLREHSNVNVLHDVAPIAGLNTGTFVMLVSPSLPAKTVPEFIAYAKANPGQINMTSSGAGNLSHLAGELFKMMADIDVVHVPYKGAVLAHAGLMAGEVHLMFDAMASALPQIRSGRLPALAVTTSKRSKSLMDIPTVAEFVPGYEVSSWLGVGAPRGTPDDVIDKLNNEINAIITDSATRSRFADLSSEPLVGSPADFRQVHRRRSRKVGQGNPRHKDQAQVVALRASGAAAPPHVGNW